MATTITANGINFPDGSASAPSIGGTDTNTGLFTGSDIVGFATGGVERIRIDANGLISIGDNTNLDSQLTITQAQGDCIRLRTSTSNNTYKYGIIKLEPYNNNALGVQIVGAKSDSGYTEVDIGGGIDGGYAATQLDFWTAANTTTATGTKRFRITSTGVIQTGTAIGASGADGNQRLVVGRDGDCNIAVRATGSTTASTGIDFGDSGDDRSGRIQYMHNGDYMSFHTNGAGSGSSNEKLRILSNGDIGVGIAAPTTQSGRVLHLHAGAAQQRFHMTNNTTGSGATDGFEIIVEQSANVRIRNFEAGNLMFDTGGSNNEAMRITSAGKIGIGTTAPPDKLNVVGAVRINQSSALDHLCNAGTMLEVRGDGIGSGVVDYDFFKGFKIALNDGTEYGGQAQFAVGRWQENGTNARSSLMISLGHGAQSSSADADSNIMLLTSDGQVRIEDGDLKIGTAGHGIDFSATSHASGMSSELLDSYEEGTWTPSLSFGGGSTGMSINKQTGYYVKIGRLVNVGGTLILSAKGSSTGSAALGGLPFSIGNHDASTSAEGGGFFTYWINMNSDKLDWTLRGSNNSSTADISVSRSGGHTQIDGATQGDFQNTSSIRFVMTYQT